MQDPALPLDRLGALSRFNKLKAPSLPRGLSNGRTMKLIRLLIIACKQAPKNAHSPGYW